jgi:hypothetical protein
LARLLTGTDRETEGRQQLSALYDTFTEGHATRDLEDRRDRGVVDLSLAPLGSDGQEAAGAPNASELKAARIAECSAN